MTDNLTVDEVCKAAGCPAPTLRAWRNRNGLFPHHTNSGGWTRYSFADAIGVKTVVLLTGRGAGFGAQESVNAVNQMREVIELSAQGAPGLVAFGWDYENDTIEWKKISPASTVRDSILTLDGPIRIVFDLTAVSFETMFSIREQRGLSKSSYAIIKGEKDV